MVLYPYFRNQLEDEQYLQGFGFRQGRFDFAITNLGLIVEVKVMRKASDVKALEAEIADDLALYFKDGNTFKTMIVYIYDDSNHDRAVGVARMRQALRPSGGWWARALRGSGNIVPFRSDGTGGARSLRTGSPDQERCSSQPG